MDDVVNVEAEVSQPEAQSTSAESMDTEDVSADNADFESEQSDESGEDNNAPESDEEAGDSVSEKANNRYQELANRNRELEAELQQTRMRDQSNQQVEQMEAQMRDAMNRLDPNTAESLQAQMLYMRLRDERREEEMAWAEAEKAHPELKDDPDLENIVFQSYLAQKQLNPNTKPKDIAKQITSYLNKKNKATSKKAYEEAENVISGKASASSTRVAASETNQAQAGERERKQVLNRYKETGDPRILDSLLDY